MSRPMILAAMCVAYVLCGITATKLGWIDHPAGWSFYGFCWGVAVRSVDAKLEEM